MISNRVMKLSEFDDAVYFRLACGCDANFHDTTIELEYDEELSNIYLRFYKDEDVVDTWEDLNWFSKLKLRIAKAYRILVRGYFSHEFCIIIDGREHIESFIEALQYGMNKLKRKRKSCEGCEYWGTDSDRFDWWPICGHPSFGDEGKVLPSKDRTKAPEWCPLL